MSEATGDWQDQAEQLSNHGVPPQRANVVALREQGWTYGEIAAELGFGADNDDRSQVKTHLDAYREQREAAAWLAEHGPEI
ncbi:helix-turn-helix domain-containing protein [Halovenus sp. HT40]|uniref:helix-turn-helix domain-containing protein n=1 Tax=Halovenus sp. HT40 TaxID=3126691 RepID=UPI00300F5047